MSKRLGLNSIIVLVLASKAFQMLPLSFHYKNFLLYVDSNSCGSKWIKYEAMFGVLLHSLVAKEGCESLETKTDEA